MADKDMIICRCEEVTYGELVETAEEYGCNARELKLRTRAGMGYCGGRTCRNMVDAVACTVTERDSTQVTLKYQPPVRPVHFGDLGAIGHD
ncbi:(2Fe-2S)-binding protein [Bhargavaea ullalensis]|uniref:NAD(P)H-nitrite reductase large subunit n=1 Tax=Bhargavaea ullalensis TaxID=1265685 RepID=A0ABV2G9I8_9BACL